MNPDPNESIHHGRFVNIICIGAGASGLLFAYKLQRSLPNFALTIYEKNPEPAGTWFENRYPGCACDVPSHNYTYSFEPKPDWTSVYPRALEIQTYFNDFSEKYGLQKYIKLCHKVQSAVWNESDCRWRLTIEDLASGSTFETFCDILIDAGGYLNHWKLPDFPGSEKFKGTLVHSAGWKDSVKLEGQKVGLIGNGQLILNSSSGVQILPAIQPVVGSLTTFIRSPTWFIPLIGTEPHDYSVDEIKDFIEQPDKLLSLRKMNEAVVNSVFSVYIQGSPLQIQSRDLAAKAMKNILKSEELSQKLIPSFGVGCRRLTLGSTYLKSLQKENVKIVHSGVVGLTEHGCYCEDGTEHDIDVLICATGFDTSFIPRFPVLGYDGLNLQDAWAETPSSYLGIAAAAFPNFFMFLGPHSPVGNGPTISAIEAQADHMLMLIDRYQTEPIRSFSPLPAAVADFAAHIASFMQSTVWMQSCRSGYKNHTTDSRLPTLWPGSTLHYMEAMKEFRADDWDIRYQGNRFAWLGNGFSQAEFDPTCDLGYVIRSEDDSSWASWATRRARERKSGTQPARELHTVHRPEPTQWYA